MHDTLILLSFAVMSPVKYLSQTFKLLHTDKADLPKTKVKLKHGMLGVVRYMLFFFFV